MKAQPHIVVVGGGITGAFTAYFLARLGGRTTIIDRAGIGQEASGHNPGGLNPRHGAGIPGPMDAFALESFHLHLANWDSIQRLSGIQFSGRRVTRIHLAMDETDRVHLRQTSETYEAPSDFAARWLGRDAVLEIEPRVSAAAQGALWSEGNAKVDPGAYTRAVAES